MNVLLSPQILLKYLFFIWIYTNNIITSQERQRQSINLRRHQGWSKDTDIKRTIGDETRSTLKLTHKRMSLIYKCRYIKGTARYILNELEYQYHTPR